MVDTPYPEKTQVNLSLRREDWEKYQKYCKSKDLIPSYEIGIFIRDEMATNGEGEFE